LRDGDLIAVGHHQMRFTSPNAKVRTPAADPAEPVEEADTTLIATRPDMVARTSSH
jgi:hypothetical protein